MEKELWKENYNKEVIKHLYFRPLIWTFIFFMAVILIMKFVLKDMLSAPLVILAAILYHVHFIDAKIDLLKRSIDKESRSKSERTLWLDEDKG